MQSSPAPFPFLTLLLILIFSASASAATIACGAAADFSAAPDTGFVGWSGACLGTTTGIVRIDAVKHVVAIFGLATAAALTVNKTADADDGVCDAADGSLREAIAVVNSAISFDLGLNGQIIALNRGVIDGGEA